MSILCKKINNNPLRLLAILILLMSAFAGLDIVEDLKNNQTLEHISVEIIIVLMSIASLYFVKELFSIIHYENISLKSDLRTYQKDLDAWKNQAGVYIKGLTEQIDLQFAKWNFTQAESEIARLLLKGLSLKEISSIRGTADRTIRQQTVSIYGKSGLSGRAELSAFFLEDLLTSNTKKTIPSKE